MSSSTSHKPPHRRGAHGGGFDGGTGDDGDGGGGGGGGRLVKVAFARNQSEAELLQGLLSEAGIPSVLKRSGGFDNPDFLAAGPHDVMVVAALAKEARQLLADTLLTSEDEEWADLAGAGGSGGETSPARLALWVGVAFLGAVILVWVLYQLS